MQHGRKIGDVEIEQHEPITYDTSKLTTHRFDKSVTREAEE